MVLKITISNVVTEKLTLHDCGYLGQIASQIQSKVYHKNTIFIANKCADQCKTKATTYTRHVPFSIVPKATHSIMELNSAVKVTINERRLTAKQQNKGVFAPVSIAANRRDK